MPPSPRQTEPEQQSGPNSISPEAQRSSQFAADQADVQADVQPGKSPKRDYHSLQPPLPRTEDETSPAMHAGRLRSPSHSAATFALSARSGSRVPARSQYKRIPVPARPEPSGSGTRTGPGLTLPQTCRATAT